LLLGAENAQREAERKYRDIFENAVEGIFQTTPDGGFITANPALARMLGFESPEELIRARTDIEGSHYVYPERRDEFKRLLDQRDTVRGFESEAYRKDGSKVWMSENVRAVRDASGKLLYYEGTVEDITERKQVEAALRESEERYRDLVENSRELICTHDLDGLILSTNPAAAAAVGYDLAEYVGKKTIRDLLAPEVKHQFDQYMARLRKEGTTSGIMLVQTRSGERRVWEYYNSLRTEGVATPIVRGMARDITDRKRAEARSAAFAALARKLSGARTQRDAGRIIVQTAVDLFGWDSCDLNLYDADRDLVHQMLNIDTIDGRLTEVPGVISDRKPTARGRRIIDHGPELLLRKEPVRFDADAIPFGDKTRPSASIMTVAIRHAAKVVGLLSVQSYTPNKYDSAALDDLQALADHCGEALNRIRAEKELRESDQRFRQLSEAAFEAIILHDQGTILEVNQSLCRMYGYERAEVIGKSVLDLALPEFRELLRQIVQSGGTDPYESPALRKDGTVFNAEVAGKPINYQGRVVRVAAIRDITEKKRNERRQAAQYAVTRVLAESATLAEATPQLLQVICESLRWKVGEFWRVCDSTNLLRCVETWHVPALDATAFIEASRKTELTPDAGLPGRVWQSGQPAWIPDVMSDPRFARAEIAAKVGLRGAVAFPILLGNHTLGVMLFFSPRAPEVDEDMLKMMSAIGSQIGQFAERKRAEEALLASERKYRDIFAFAPVGIYQSLRDGTIITANHTLAEMLGYDSVDEFLKVDLANVYFTPAEREKLILEYEGRGHASDLELRWKRKDGAPLWVQLTTHAIKGTDGLTKYCEGFVRDVSEHKRAEGALRQTEQQYESLVHSIDGIVWEVDPRTFRFIFVSRQAERLLGYPLARWLSEPNFWANHIHLDDRDWAVDFCLKATARQEDHQFEYRMIAADGHAVWLKDNVTVSIMDDKSVRLRGVMVDITERKRAEEALRESEERLRLALDAAHMGTFDWDVPRNRITWSRWHEELWGFKPGEFEGTYEAFSERVHHDDLPGINAEVARCIAAREAFVREFRVAWPDGSVHWVQGRGEVTLGDDGQPARMRGVVVEITERKLQEEALHESEAMLKQSQRVAALGHYALDVATGLWTSSEVLDEIFGIGGAYAKNVEGWLDIVHPEQRDEMYAYLRDRVLKEGNSFDREYRIVRINDSAVRWVHGLGNLEFNTEGQPARMFGVIQDITERKLIAEALRDSEERYRDLVENIQDLVCTHDLEGRVLSANRALEELLGYDLKDFGEKTFREILAPEARDRFDDYLVRIRRDGVASGLMLVQTSTGERRIWEYHNTLRTEGVATPIVRSLARDVTEQRRAEKVMFELRRELELTMNSMEEGVHRVDLKGNIVFENPAAARMLGWEVSELLGKSGHLTMHHTRRDGTPYPKEECPIYATFSDGVSRQVADEVFWRRDGTSFPVEYTTAPMRNDRDEIVATVVTFRDITDRKVAEGALRESEERYRELFENAKDAIYVHDLEGVYMSLNRAAERLSGYRREEILGKPFWELVAPEYVGQLRENVRKKLEEVGETNYEVEIIHKDGARVPVEVSSRLIYEDGVAIGVQGSARDITERKRAQRALLTYSRRLIAAQEAERRRIARELHDQIGQVLTALKLNTHAIQSARDGREAGPLIADNLKMLDEALEQVRDLSVELRPLLLDDLGLVTALRWYVDRQTQRTGVLAEFISDSLEPDLRLTSELETACFRIAQEALTNVARHAHAKLVTVRLSRNGPSLILLIEDDGVGFDIEALQGQALANATLGLRGMQERAHAVGGRIKIDSATDKGTQVFVELPIAMPNGKKPQLHYE
jgi:PAS domain S-box-containing protein